MRSAHRKPTPSQRAVSRRLHRTRRAIRRHHSGLMDSWPSQRQNVIPKPGQFRERVAQSDLCLSVNQRSNAVTQTFLSSHFLSEFTMAAKTIESTGSSRPEVVRNRISSTRFSICFHCLVAVCVNTLLLRKSALCRRKVAFELRQLRTLYRYTLFEIRNVFSCFAEKPFISFILRHASHFSSFFSWWPASCQHS